MREHKKMHLFEKQDIHKLKKEYSLLINGVYPCLKN